ncbi:MAG: putative toxin-antitoxin system toxin component, PIN family [Flavobacteriales bacterium]|nr:putative toxin-antitoxin system toxin component, PIN family [Flavobacteriales bacterium]
MSVLIGKRLAPLKALFHEAAYLLVMDETLIAEFDEMARRTKFRKYFPAEIVDLVVQQLREGGEVADAPRNIERICRDPDDDYLLALCKSAKVDVLLTGDEDLLVLKKYGRTRIMNARAFVDHFMK